MKEKEIYEFEIQRKELAKEFAKLNKLRERFVYSFEINKINNLSLEKYVVGKQSKKSFCYRIETELQELGNMKGSTSDKFGVYFGKKGKDKEVKYRFTGKYGTDVEEAFIDVKSEITKLLNAGISDDTNSIIKSKIAPLFRYKLLGTYFPDKYLNVYSKEHLDYFIGEFGINSKSKSIFGKQSSLLEFKNNNEISKGWTNLEFSRFLYYKIGGPPKDDIDKAKIQIVPPLSQVRLELIDLDFTNRELTHAKSTRKRKIDYIKQNLRNTQVGMRGENLVFNYELEQAHERNQQASLIVHTSKVDDNAGYDIKSIDSNGLVKYIEVKSTKAKPGILTLNITDNELRKAKELDNYFIYVVFEANTKSPKLWMMNKAFKNYIKDIKLHPIAYRVYLNTDESRKNDS